MLPEVVDVCIMCTQVSRCNLSSNAVDIATYYVFITRKMQHKNYIASQKKKATVLGIDQARLYQFLRDLIAYRDWYDRDSGCILSRDELCDIIKFLAAN